MECRIRSFTLFIIYLSILNSSIFINCVLNRKYFLKSKIHITNFLKIPTPFLSKTILDPIISNSIKIKPISFKLSDNDRSDKTKLLDVEDDNDDDDDDDESDNFDLSGIIISYKQVSNFD